MKKEKPTTANNGEGRVKCPICDLLYESGRSECPKCGAANLLFESPTYVKFEVEMERALYRAMQRWRGEMSDAAFVIECVENEITRRNSKRV